MLFASRRSSTWDFVSLALLLEEPDHLYCRPSLRGLCLLHAQIWADCGNCGLWHLGSRPCAQIAQQFQLLAVASGIDRLCRGRRGPTMVPMVLRVRRGPRPE